MKMNKNSLTKIITMASIAGMITAYGCGPSAAEIAQAKQRQEEFKKDPDTQYKPYKAISLKDLSSQPPNTRVIVKGRIRGVGDENLALEYNSDIITITRNYYGRSNILWDSIANMLRKNIVNPSDSNSVYNKTIKIYGIINDKKTIEMRFIDTGTEFYEAYK